MIKYSKMKSISKYKMTIDDLEDDMIRIPINFHTTSNRPNYSISSARINGMDVMNGSLISIHDIKKRNDKIKIMGNITRSMIFGSFISFNIMRNYYSIFSYEPYITYQFNQLIRQKLQSYNLNDLSQRSSYNAIKRFKI